MSLILPPPILDYIKALNTFPPQYCYISSRGIFLPCALTAVKHMFPDLLGLLWCSFYRSACVLNTQHTPLPHFRFLSALCTGWPCLVYLNPAQDRRNVTHSVCLLLLKERNRVSNRAAAPSEFKTPPTFYGTCGCSVKGNQSHHSERSRARDSELDTSLMLVTSLV